MYALNLDPETNRVLSVTLEEYAVSETLLVESFPEGNVADYLYENNEFVYDPLPEQIPAPTQLDRIEAQLMFTALVTDTMIEEDE